jgi:hypothetical protein
VKPRSGNRFARRVFTDWSRSEVGMQEARSFAYSLSQRENDWSWSVYDEDGVTVAGGAHASRAAAEAAVESTLRGVAQFGGAAAA